MLTQETPPLAPLSHDAPGHLEGLTPELLARCLSQPYSQAELQRFTETAVRQTQCLLARFAPVAAAKLAELLDSDKPDIVRRTALDLLDRCLPTAKPPGDHPDDSSSKHDTDDQLREKLLALAAGFKLNPEVKK